MKVLVIGSGGREHALCWKLSSSPTVEKVYCAPGNAGMKNVQRVELPTPDDAAAFAENEGIGLTVVGPEAPLCDGIVDAFRARELPIFGPTQAAARLEGSKSFAKDFMKRRGIPTADFARFTDPEAAKDYVRQRGTPIVVKADGLAAGKGVTVADSVAEACDSIDRCFGGDFGAAGASVVVEECLTGEEASILAFTDGRTILPLASSQDHKRAGDGDTGPNTGGMGAYSPAPVVTPAMWKQLDTEVLTPFLNGCREEGLDYRGVIYAGIMVTTEGPKVLEFNVRFGDPETQAVLPRLKSDLAAAMLATVNRRLDEVTLDWADEAAVCVVLASGGYPGSYRKGYPIHGIEAAEAAGALVFHAGTDLERSQLVTAGGRVLGVTGRGDGIREALQQAYAGVRCIDWRDVTFRRDIAYRALNRGR